MLVNLVVEQSREINVPGFLRAEGFPGTRDFQC